ncbi:unnamed protein product [Pelagomonas calceolata]|uniref:BspA family leucine-rich repeat surface protein n=1 Tax=Pelagomonas calceolata TaxID=35677 RepID=A0A8J2SAN9_9STRA|nr:unnamed protein product [Pelagomonas calceolata]
MHEMFKKASAFNQYIGGWAIQSVRNMWMMFQGASAFDQDLGWCVANKVKLNRAFDKTKCASTSCGAVQVADVADCPTPARKAEADRLRASRGVRARAEPPEVGAEARLAAARAAAARPHRPNEEAAPQGVPQEGHAGRGIEVVGGVDNARKDLSRLKANRQAIQQFRQFRKVHDQIRRENPRMRTGSITSE